MPALSPTERTQRQRRKTREAGCKRVDVMLSQEARAALEFLTADGSTDRDIIDAAVRTMAKLQGFECD